VAEPVVLDPNQLVAGIQSFLARTIGENVELQTDLYPSTPNVRCDPMQLEQVLINLAVNARDAMPDGGRVRIETRGVELDSDGPRSIHDLPSGSYAELRLIDTGTGMSHDVVERVFEPFFTTNEKGKGTGLGMAMIYGIAKNAGGTALVESIPGKGTTVRVLLPRSEEDVSPVDDDGAGAPPEATGAKVLVVEDEPVVRRLVERILGKHGYDVVSAADPGEALELAEAGDIDVLLTDIVMPGMTGTRLAEQFVSRRPGTPVIFMTGYTDRPDELPAGAPVLLKPFDADELLRVIASA
jgi:CheY-like chemotaxis protein